MTSTASGNEIGLTTLRGLLQKHEAPGCHLSINNLW